MTVSTSSVLDQAPNFDRNVPWAAIFRTLGIVMSLSKKAWVFQRQVTFVAEIATIDTGSEKKDDLLIFQSN